MSSRDRLDQIFVGRRYRLAFLEKCHRLISIGYTRLNCSSFSTAEETEITGELVRAITEVLDDPSGPNWTRYFFVADDPPQNTSGRLGRRRTRVDIEFTESRVAPRSHFRIEAKRLYRISSITDYLGQDGLGMFLTGAYGADEDEGGMLGYVQSGEVTQWLERLSVALVHSLENRWSICAGSALEVLQLGSSSDDVIHLSCHDRNAVGRRIHIFHTLLLFS